MYYLSYNILFIKIIYRHKSPGDFTSRRVLEKSLPLSGNSLTYLSRTTKGNSKDIDMIIRNLNESVFDINQHPNDDNNFKNISNIIETVSKMKHNYSGESYVLKLPVIIIVCFFICYLGRLKIDTMLARTRFWRFK